MNKNTIFKTNLSMVPNKTKLLFVADAHNLLGLRLNVVRSTQHLAKQGYNSFVYEKPPGVEEVYDQKYKFFAQAIKSYNKEALAYMLSMNEKNFHVAKNAILKWEADTFKIKTFYCDDSAFCEDISHLDIDGERITAMIANVYHTETARLKSTYPHATQDIAADFKYAMYGPKTFSNHVAGRDMPDDYKTDIANVGSALRKAIIELDSAEDSASHMKERNFSMAKEHYNCIQQNPAFKGYSLIGLKHLIPLHDETIPTLPAILEQEYNIASVKVGMTSIQNITRASLKIKNAGFDLGPVCLEEVLPLSVIYFGLTPLELMHLMQNNTADLTEGVYEVQDKSLGLDYEIFLPACDEQEYKVALINKICSKF